MKPMELVENFVTAWVRADADELAAFFTDDAVYHNMPMDPVQGRDQIREFLAAYLAKMVPEKFTTVNRLAGGSVVMVERLDVFRPRHKHGPRVELPVVGVFETEGERIRAWRDYFDFATFAKVLTD